MRGIFWRLMPFPQEIRDNLKNRGFVYSELHEKGQGIARSDGCWAAALSPLAPLHLPSL